MRPNRRRNPEFGPQDSGYGEIEAVFGELFDLDTAALSRAETIKEKVDRLQAYVDAKIMEGTGKDVGGFMQGGRKEKWWRSQGEKWIDEALAGDTEEDIFARLMVARDRGFSGSTTKGKVYAGPDVSGMKEEGADSGAAFMVQQLYNASATKPNTYGSAKTSYAVQHDRTDLASSDVDFEMAYITTLPKFFETLEGMRNVEEIYTFIGMFAAGVNADIVAYNLIPGVKAAIATLRRLMLQPLEMFRQQVLDVCHVNIKTGAEGRPEVSTFPFEVKGSLKKYMDALTDASKEKWKVPKGVSYRENPGEPYGGPLYANVSREIMAAIEAYGLVSEYDLPVFVLTKATKDEAEKTVGYDPNSDYYFIEMPRAIGKTQKDLAEEMAALSYEGWQHVRSRTCAKLFLGICGLVNLPNSSFVEAVKGALAISTGGKAAFRKALKLSDSELQEGWLKKFRGYQTTGGLGVSPSSALDLEYLDKLESRIEEIVQWVGPYLGGALPEIGSSESSLSTGMRTTVKPYPASEHDVLGSANDRSGNEGGQKYSKAFVDKICSVAEELAMARLYGGGAASGAGGVLEVTDIKYPHNIVRGIGWSEDVRYSYGIASEVSGILKAEVADRLAEGDSKAYAYGRGVPLNGAVAWQETSLKDPVTYSYTSHEKTFTPKGTSGVEKQMSRFSDGELAVLFTTKNRDTAVSMLAAPMAGSILSDMESMRAEKSGHVFELGFLLSALSEKIGTATAEELGAALTTRKTVMTLFGRAVCSIDRKEFYASIDAMPDAGVKENQRRRRLSDKQEEWVGNPYFCYYAAFLMALESFVAKKAARETARANMREKPLEYNRYGTPMLPGSNLGYYPFYGKELYRQALGNEPDLYEYDSEEKYALRPDLTEKEKYAGRQDKRLLVNAPQEFQDWKWMEQDLGVRERKGGVKKLTELDDPPGRAGPDLPEGGAAGLSETGITKVVFGSYVANDETFLTFHVRSLFAGLYDLADLMGIDFRSLGRILLPENGVPYEAGGTNTWLKFGIGWGGIPGAAAHYSFGGSEVRYINMTKKNGPGSLGHEMMHFIDNVLFLATKRWDPAPRNIGTTFGNKSGKQFLSAAWYASGWDFASKPEQVGRYAVSLPIFIETDINAAGFRAKHDTELTQDERKASADVLATFHKLMRIIYGAGPNFTISHLKKPGYMSDYAMRAAFLGFYWCTPWEMLARAFETWLADTMTAAERNNSYLVKRAKTTQPYGYKRINNRVEILFAYPQEEWSEEVDDPFDPGGGKKKFVKEPRERKPIVKAMDEFVKALAIYLSMNFGRTDRFEIGMDFVDATEEEDAQTEEAKELENEIAEESEENDDGDPELDDEDDE